MAERKRLPDERTGRIHKFGVGKDPHIEIYVKTGEYADGSVGELFLKADKQGSFVSGILDGFAILFSLALQHGVPLDAIVSKLRNVHFEPHGRVEGGQLDKPNCTSVIDYLARWLEARYLKAKTKK